MSGTTKQKILSGARECLVREGHARSTVKRIAHYAGVNHGLLHHYFGSKEELMVALLEQLTENMLKELFQNPYLTNATKVRQRQRSTWEKSL